MSYELASLAGCALGPTFGSMQRIGVGPSHTVLVTGLGPVGEVRLFVRGAGLNRWPEVPVDRLDVLAELGPARQAVALGNGELGAAELGVGVGRLALPVEVPGLVAQVLQARSAWQVARCHDTPLGHACVRISGPRRVSVGHCCRAQVGSALPADRVRPARSCERSSAPREAPTTALTPVGRGRTVPSAAHSAPSPERRIAPSRA